MNAPTNASTASTLSEDQLSELGRLLDERESQLQAEVRGAKEASADDRERQAGVVPDTVDMAEARRSGDMRHAETERDVGELLEIDQARERLRDGSYGICVECDLPIGFERLKVEPSAQRCIECQGLYERSHRAVPLVPTGLDQP